MTSLKEMMAQADAAVPRLSPAQARELIQDGKAIALDVRDPSEVAASGKLKGACAVSRGMLEFRADPASRSHLPALRTDQPVIVYCGSGGRAALAGRTLKELGYTTVYNGGGFKDLAEAGIEVEKA